MKTKISLILFSAFAAFPATSHAALVVQYSLNNATTSPSVEAEDWADNVTPSALGPSSTITRSGGFLQYEGWGQAVDSTKYVGFVLTADPGFQMNLTDLAFYTASSSSASRAASFVWGMRIDNGSGYGAWVYDQTYATGDNGFTTLNAKTWDFADVFVTKSVEFALFGSAVDGTRRIEVVRDQPMIVNGTVTAVPEPSSAILGALGALAILRRRR